MHLVTMKECAVTIGFFDGVHLGHRCLLRQLEELATARGLVPVAVTFDRHPLEVVGNGYMPSLLNTAAEKAARLGASFGGEVVVLPFTKELSRMSAREFMQSVLRDKLHASVLLMGYDHHFGHGGGTPEQYAAWGKEVGIEVRQAMVLEGEKVSSSLIRRHITEGLIAEANKLLGYTYYIYGEVTEGKQIGRQMGFPTANIVLPEHKLCPGCGVYAAIATLPDGTRHGSMLCIGHRPTVEDAGAISIEAHIFDFTGDLYGQNVRLELIGRLRDERRLDSLEALQQQLTIDAREARQITEQAG